MGKKHQRNKKNQRNKKHNKFRPRHHNWKNCEKPGFQKHKTVNMDQNNSDEIHNKYKRLLARNTLCEKDIGVTMYAGNAARISGVLKSRFSDFHVNEIDMNGIAVKLTEKTCPTEPEIDKSKLSSIDDISKLFGDDNWTNIKMISDTNKSVQIEVTELDKDQRTSMHLAIKNEFKSIYSRTIEKDGKKFIVCAKNKIGWDQRKKWLWPHEYTHFLVYKENIDTMSVATYLSQNLGCKPSSICYAGTKDKRAKCTQWFCMRKRQPSEIIRAVRASAAVHVGNFTFKPNTLKLGLLKGNRFRIAIRNIIDDETVVERCVESLKNNGFINYYGLQRFGNNVAVPTHEIGIALLKGLYKEACELILKPRDGEDIFMKNIREYWWKTRDASGALNKFYRNNKPIEAKLLQGLANHDPNDYFNALENVPRNMRLMYIHAYQSLIWNEIVSRRIHEYGLTPKVGDLVLIDNQDETIQQSTDTIDPETMLFHLTSVSRSDVIETDNKELNDGDAESANNVITIDNDNNKKESVYKAMVKALTEDDIKSETYTIYDIVLPLPGYDIAYPKNDCGAWYEERLAKDQLSSEKLKQTHKTYSLCGAYRKILLKPTNMSWYFMKYNSPEDNLILSDIEELKNLPTPQTIFDGKYKALILDLCLSSSSYATMALREILNDDTSPESQSKLNNPVDISNAENMVIVKEKITDNNLKRKLVDDTSAESQSKLNNPVDISDISNDKNMDIKKQKITDNEFKLKLADDQISGESQSKLNNPVDIINAEDMVNVKEKITDNELKRKLDDTSAESQSKLNNPVDISDISNDKNMDIKKQKITDNEFKLKLADDQISGESQSKLNNPVDISNAEDMVIVKEKITDNELKRKLDDDTSAESQSKLNNPVNIKLVD